jgi:holo-[acyl-carrier protein] synthase
MPTEDRIRVGVDLVEVGRVERLLSRYEHARERLFTPGEIEYCGSRFERLAARFAAKEAVLKALGSGKAKGMRWRDVEVVSSPNGRPAVRLDGAVAALAQRSGVRGIDISLSHTRELAMAQAVAF